MLGWVALILGKRIFRVSIIAVSFSRLLSEKNVKLHKASITNSKLVDMKKTVYVTALLALLFLVAPIAQVTMVDANPYSYPSLWIESPENTVYNTTTISVIFHTDTPIQYPEIVKMSCSLDGTANRTLSISKSQSFLKFGTSTYSYVGTGLLTDLSNGTHYLDVYALDSKGTTMTYPTGRSFQVNITPKSEQPLAISSITIILVMAIIAVTIGTVSTVTLLKRKMKKISK
jgi:hypothetical protein